MCDGSSLGTSVMTLSLWQQVQNILRKYTHTLVGKIAAKVDPIPSLSEMGESSV